MAAGFTPPYPNFVNDLGGGASLEQALTPYPQYGGYYPAYEMDGTAFYNSLQFEGQRRFSNGFSLLSQITFARDTSNEANGSVPAAPNGLNAYDPQAEWGPSFYDQLYASSIVGTYELPIGPGKLILNSHNLASNLLGGWTVSGILQYAGGFPMGTLSSGNPLLVNGFNRPNIVPGVSLATFSYGRTRDYYTGKSSVLPVQFTTNAFANPGTWGVGTSIRAYRALRTEPLRREDFVAIKDFHIEKLKASIRMDYFNAFNRTRFIWPDITATSSTFGEVTSLSSQLPNRQGQAEFRIEF